MEDMVIVAGRGCTNAVLVELVCAGLDHLETKDGRLSLRLHTLGRRCHGRRLRQRKARGVSGLLHISIQSSSCTDEDDIYLSPCQSLRVNCRTVILL